MSWQIEGLSKSFCIRRGFSSHSFPVLTDLSLQVSKGEFVGLAGASGSGKTTLAHIAMRLISADAGNMVLGGKPYGSIMMIRNFTARFNWCSNTPAKR